MPIPKPQKDESKDDFISRCMGDEVMKNEYTDTGQRLAVCYSQWDDKMKKKSEIRATELNAVGRAHANALIEAGKVDRGGDWIFSADDGNAILGSDNWSEYARWFLGIESDAENETREHYKYPFGKDGKLYRAALVAIRQRAAAQGATSIFEAAGNLLEKIDGPTAKKVRPDNIEYRTYTAEMKYDAEKRVFSGHAAVFNIEAGPEYFREQISPGAFAETIEKDDIRALFNHDPNYVLGRNVSGTLKLWEDERGLGMEVTPPDTQWARDLAVSIDRGDISQQSFGFMVAQAGGEEWIKGENGKPDVRVLKKVRLFDVSIVTYPFYPDTDVAVRSWHEWREVERQDAENDKRNKRDIKKRELEIKRLRLKGKM